MIRGILQRLFRLNYEYDSLILQQRAQRLLYMLGISIITVILWLLFVSIPAIINGSVGPENTLIPAVFLVVNIVLYQLIQRGYVVRTSQIFVAILLLVCVPFSAEDLVEPTVVNAMLPVVLAGVLLSRRTAFVVTAIVVTFFLRASLFSGTFEISIPAVVGATLVISLSGVFLILFTNSLEEITKTADDLVVKTRKLSLSINEGSSNQTTRDIVASAITQLRTQLQFSYIRVVLLDDNQHVIHTYYSSIGLERIAEATNFSYTENSAFQQALDTESIQFLSNDDDGNLIAHLLPSSNSGVIIPGRHLGQIVALFDIQSESNIPITSELAAVLSLYVSQIASELSYQLAVSTYLSDIEEQQTIIDQQREQIQNMQLLQTQGIVTDWQSYLEQRGLSAIGYNIDTTRRISDIQSGDIPAELRPAFENGEIIVEPHDTKQHIIIPIRFRDTVLGVISFNIPKEIPITDRKLDFIRSVTERLALALDNKRLLEQTQVQAQRESTANAIGSDLLSSTDIQSVLQTAVSRFNEALGAVSTQIYLQPTSLQSVDQKQREDAV